METWNCFISAKQAAKLARMKYSTLHYWLITGLLPEPTVPARGTGTRRMFGLLDVVRARAVAALRKQGVSLQLIRRVVTELTDRWNVVDPLAESWRLLVIGDDILWDLDDKALLDVTTGQLSAKGLAIVPVGEIIQDSMERMAALCAA